MAKKVIQSIQLQEKLEEVLRINYFLAFFSLFFAVSKQASAGLIIFVPIMLTMFLFSFLLILFIDRLPSQSYRLTMIALLIVDALLCVGGFTYLTIDPTLWLVFIVSIATIYIGIQDGFWIVLLATSMAVGWGLLFGTDYQPLNAIYLIIFYLFTCLIAQHFGEKEKELESAQDELISSERSSTISKIAMTLSHEINNPLTSVIINTEILKKIHNKGITDTGKENNIIDSISKETKRMKTIMDDLRNLSARMIEDEYVDGNKIYNIQKSVDTGKNQYNKRVDGHKPRENR